MTQFLTDSVPTESTTGMGNTKNGGTMDILSPDRMQQLQAVQGSRGVVSSLVAKACLLTGNNGSDWYVNVLEEAPQLRESTNKEGELTYRDSDGEFSLAKLAQAVENTITRKREKASADAISAGTGDTFTFPNVAMIRDDSADTVYIANYDAGEVWKAHFAAQNDHDSESS